VYLGRKLLEAALSWRRLIAVVGALEFRVEGLEFEQWCARPVTFNSVLLLVLIIIIIII